MSDRDDFGAFLMGFVVGGVAGAVAALLLAPQSGEETRTLIKDKSIELRDMAAEQADELATRAGAVATDARARGKDLVDSAKKAVARKRPPEMPVE
jgi:gas vesicle protein